MSNNTQKKILVVAQTEAGKITRITLELIYAAAGLASKIDSSIHTVVVGADISEPAADLAKYTTALYTIEDPCLKEFMADRYLQVLANLCSELRPDIILLAHDLDNIDLAPGLAFTLGTTLITDCIDLDIEAGTGNLLCTKEVYGGNANAVFEHSGEPAIATIRPKGLRGIELSSLNGKVVPIKPQIDESKIQFQVVETITNPAEDYGKADVVVAGGRGIGGSDGVKQLEDLVGAFKNAFENVFLGGSRPAIDEGWMPAFRQIGLTGEKVNPGIYVAVGISGALQHMSGIFGSKVIVAVNNNPEAAIFKYADYGVVGDFRDILSSFTQDIRKAS